MNNSSNNSRNNDLEIPTWLFTRNRPFEPLIFYLYVHLLYECRDGEKEFSSSTIKRISNVVDNTTIRNRLEFLKFMGLIDFEIRRAPIDEDIRRKNIYKIWLTGRNPIETEES